MTVLAALDERGGMMFNGRRQSQDKLLRQRIVDMTQGSCLRMNAYTFKQFTGMDAAQIQVSEDFLQTAGENDFCLVENVSAAPYADKIQRLILFFWNRDYPNDFRFDIDWTAPPWKKMETLDFPGFSHEKITQEVYIREQ